MGCRKGSKRRKLATAIVAFVTSILALSSGYAYGGCLQDGGTILQSLNCLGLPTIDKYTNPKTFQWKGKEILAINTGNELHFWNITNPASPVSLAKSNFNIPNQGDSDYDLVTYSVCDDCKFGIASFKLGTVIWDLGTGNYPTFGARTFYSGAPNRLSYSYKNNANQYVISADLPNGIGGMFDKGTIYKIVNHNNPVPVSDFIFPTGMTFQAPVAGGFDLGYYLLLGITGGIYSYMKDSDNLIYINDTGMKAQMGWNDAIDISGNLAVTAERGTTVNGLKLWDITNPHYAIQLFKYPGRFKFSSFSGQCIFTSDNSNNPLTFKVDGNQIVPLDHQFWSASNPWNQWPVGCTYASGAAFSNNGMFAYLARYSVVQKVNFTACSGIQTPTPTPTAVPVPTCVPGCIN